MAAAKVESSSQFKMTGEFRRALSAPAKKSTTSQRSTGKNTSRIWSRCSRLNDVILSGVKRSRKDYDWPSLRRDPEIGYPDFSPGRCSAANARQEQLPPVGKTPD